MKIAFFADTFYPSVDGVVSSMLTTATELAKRGHEIVFFVPKPKHPIADFPYKEFKVVWIHAVSLLSYDQYRITSPFSFTAQVAFKEFSPDLVHCHTPFSMGWMGINLAKKYGAPSVATYHTLLPDFLMYAPIPVLNKTQFAKELTWEYTKLFYRKASLVTTPSTEMVQELEKRKIPAVFISNPVQFRLFNRFAKTKKSTKEFRLVFFGRLSFEKNIEVILQAIKILASTHPTIRLVIIGSGPAENMLHQTVSELGIEKKVEFTGVLRAEALAQKVASCNCSVTASTIETQGLTILEGMAAGLPCVGANYLAIPASVHDDQNGFLFKPFDASDCAQKIEKLLSSKALQKKFSKKAIETAKPYSAEKICDEWEQTYQKLVISAPKNPSKAGTWYNHQCL